MRRALLILGCMLVFAGCGSDNDEGWFGYNPDPDASTTTSAPDLTNRIRSALGVLHRSQIQEIPGLVALFYHSPDGWAVEDSKLTADREFCRHAWYTWTIEDPKAIDDFTVRYSPTNENPSCAPLNQDLVMKVTGVRTENGRRVFTGEYEGFGWHFTRTVCPGDLSTYDDVCGESSGQGAPTENSPVG